MSKKETIILFCQGSLPIPLPLKPNGETNYGIFNWDKITGDGRYWLKEQQHEAV